MAELEKLKKMLEKDWFVVMPSRDTQFDSLAEILNQMSGSKKGNMKVVDISGKLAKVTVIMVKKTPYVMKNLDMNKKSLKGLIEIVILPDQRVFSIGSKTQNKKDKNKAINDVLKSLNEVIENREEIERENLSMYR